MTGAAALAADRAGRRYGDTFCQVEGAGPPVVLIHGVGLDHTMWDHVGAALSGAFTVVRYDMLGHGRSANPQGLRELGDFRDQLWRLLDDLGLTAAHLVGFSMGGLVAQRVALDHPGRVRRLVLMSTVYDRPADARQAVLARVAQVEREGAAATMDAALARWFSPAFRSRHPDVVAAVRLRLEGNDPRGYLEAYRVFATADRDLAGRLGAIAAPTLVMTGALDTGATPDMAERMADAIPGAILDVVADQRHMLPVEGADIVSRMLIEFLQGSRQEGDPRALDNHRASFETRPRGRSSG